MNLRKDHYRFCWATPARVEHGEQKTPGTPRCGSPPGVSRIQAKALSASPSGGLRAALSLPPSLGLASTG